MTTAPGRWLIGGMLIAACGGKLARSEADGFDVPGDTKGDARDAGRTTAGRPSFDPPPPVVCRSRTCAAADANCGPIEDGCGALLDCGACAPDRDGAWTWCGGGGIPNRCGNTGPCPQRSCEQVGANCGPMSDGCGALIHCGVCTPPETCGGGIPSRCGMGPMDAGPPRPPPCAEPCVPTTCASFPEICGAAPDGCGGLVLCRGGCGGGRDGGVCVPRHCGDPSAECGLQADGCGSVVQCGGCRGGETCIEGRCAICN